MLCYIPNFTNELSKDYESIVINNQNYKFLPNLTKRTKNTENNFKISLLFNEIYRGKTIDIILSRKCIYLSKKISSFHLLYSCIDILGMGIATLFIGLCVRSAVSFSVTIGTGFNLKERIFITLTWLSKATVQVFSILYL